MAQLQKGVTFNPGDIVDAADLNNLVDAATALAGLITDPAHLAVNASTGDKVLLSRSGVLKQADVSTFPQGITSVHLTATPASVFNVTGTPTITTSGTFGVELDDQTGNKVLAAPADGSSAAPSFRALVPADAIMFQEVAALTINCALGNVFRKQLSANSTLRLNNGVLGQEITVYLIQNGGGNNNTVTWTSDDSGHVIRWPGGTDHTMTGGGLGVTDIVNFLCMGSGLYYGTFDKNFLP